MDLRLLQVEKPELQSIFIGEYNPSYRMIYVMGRLAVLDEYSKRRFEFLAPETTQQEELINLVKQVEDFEREICIAVLGKYRGSKARAAVALGMHKRTFGHLCKRLNINVRVRLEEDCDEIETL